MLISIDVDAYYEWEDAPEGYQPTPDEIRALLYKPAEDGGWLKKITVDEETHTAINIPETQMTEAEGAAKLLGRSFNRAMFVANLIDTHVMKHHAPQHGFTKVTVHDEPELESALNAMLVNTKRK